LRLKRANIFLSNYLEQGSPHIDGLHFCLTNGSPIKKSIRIKKFEKDKKNMMMMIWLYQEETKKKRRNGEHIRGK